VQSITRRAGGVEVQVAGQERECFDHVVIAAHSNQAIRMLSDPSERERKLLGAIAYQQNEAVLHTDSTLLPRRRAARAAWNFHLLDEPKPLSTVTYYMNHLQRLASDRDFCVTLNHTEAIDPARIIRTMTYSHPVYTPDAVAAQARHAEISGLPQRTLYCGAYWGSGFHEDGVLSAVRACAPLGVTL
jgi:predicted NAD/FAD-binding protein